MTRPAKDEFTSTLGKRETIFNSFDCPNNVQTFFIEENYDANVREIKIRCDIKQILGECFIQ